ncbi:DUF1392 family protein [Nostoc sp.]
MIDNVNALKTSWYLSPPWGQTIPPVAVNLLERVFLRTTRTFGYCCGMSPTLIKTPTISNRFSLVGEKSLVRVNT